VIKINNITKRRLKWSVFLLLLVWYYFSLPTQLFNAPTSTVIESSEGRLLGAKIASDGQWRFPHNDSVPTKFKTCIVQFEDAYFYRHIGINPVSIAKALAKNITSKKIKRGGSTITQQVIRLSRKGKARTYKEKIIEMILATRLEFRFSKDKILSYYVSNAPFGGNVVGLDAASWRYFNCSPSQLSWAECATLAVLPNAPSLIYPGKNQTSLLKKRNRLLNKLLKNKKIDSITYQLAIAEDLPQKAFSIPNFAPHLLQKIDKNNKGKKIRTTIDFDKQVAINNIVKESYKELKQNHIYNIAVIVMEVHTRNVLAYVGNSPTGKSHQKDVDVITKPRSTGSILKPFLFAGMLDQGEILPQTLIPDIPTQIANYNPQNFDKKFDGAVSASEALYRSLNIPAVRMLKQFGIEKFHYYLKQLKLKDVKFSPDHYGLSLILGGAESNLWDITKSYASFASTINHYHRLEGAYFENEFVEPIIEAQQKVNFGKKTIHKPLFDAGSIYLTLEALTKVNRPMGEDNWEFYDSGQKIAWKTGTSFGFRDAWAIGTTKDYTVGVWVGNADGEGRAGLVGVRVAAPILFSVFEQLPKAEWFNVPLNELEEVNICSKSGQLPLENCESIQKQLIPIVGKRTAPCSYHTLVHLNQEETHRVNSSCYDLNKMKHKKWFSLPPLMEYYYQKKHSEYKPLPPYLKECITNNENQMEFIYPKANAKIYLPKDFDEKTNPLILKITHRNAKAIVFWYLDAKYLGQTKDIHEMQVFAKKGKHLLTVIDQYGNETKQWIEII